ncbi:potassium transporter TrkA [Aliidiomarina shirensis]|uniref:Potassium transporter TrkA n=1 Tax=Aliidiomarina shirensis TaxID=1048642 RepID=A0A432WSM0_9GAMM|nr:TrkA family potassium uptake protein [Aliidiomarina shirensis]RUO36759.1 potassium transporter TrkA [Aliidiomarina shirensis]
MAYFAVIGLGRFGTTTSLELMHLGNEVLGIDIDPKAAEPLAERLSQTIIADATDERALKELNLGNCDGIVVAIGEDLQASLLCTLNLLNLGIRCLWVKAGDSAHHSILSKLGVRNIVHPEEEMGIRVAQSLNYPMVNSYIGLGHNTYIVDVNITEKISSKTVGHLRKATGNQVNILLVKRDIEMFHHPDDNFALQNKDHLVLVGARDVLTKLGPLLK